MGFKLQIHTWFTTVGVRNKKNVTHSLLFFRFLHIFIEQLRHSKICSQKFWHLLYYQMFKLYCTSVLLKTFWAFFFYSEMIIRTKTIHKSLLNQKYISFNPSVSSLQCLIFFLSTNFIHCHNSKTIEPRITFHSIMIPLEL